jgi:hypothetical protein
VVLVHLFIGQVAWLCAAVARIAMEQFRIHFPLQIFRGPTHCADMEMLNPFKS